MFHQIESSAIMAKSENSMSDLGVLFYDLPLRLLPILRLKSPILPILRF